MGLDVMINRDPKYQWLKSDEFISLLRNSPHLAWHLSFMRTVKKPRFLLSCCSDIEYHLWDIIPRRRMVRGGEVQHPLFSVSLDPGVPHITSFYISVMDLNPMATPSCQGSWRRM